MTKEKLNQLKETLKFVLNEVAHVKEIKQEIGEEFIARNLSAYRAMNVFMGIESLDTLTNSEDDARFLFIFTVGLNRAIGEPEFEVDVDEYFTKLEYNKWINYREEEEPENIFPIVFENTIQLTDNIWQTKISAQRLEELDRNNAVSYTHLGIMEYEYNNNLRQGRFKMGLWKLFADDFNSMYSDFVNYFRPPKIVTCLLYTSEKLHQDL